MATFAGKPSSFYSTTGGKPVEGAYYSGQRYLGGKLLAAGEHQPGQKVSDEVIAQTDPANVEYIKSLRGGQPKDQPKSKEEVTPFLNDFQGNLLNESQAPGTRAKTSEEIKAEVLPETELPSLLNRTEAFEKLRTEHGLSDLEKTLSDLKAQEDELYAGLREQKFTEEGKPVPLNVISGRISEEERQYSERVDYLGRQKSRVVDELNTKYALVNQIMGFKGLDYNDAVDNYQTEFSNNLKVYDLVADSRKEARSAYEYDRDAAKSNLQVYANAITEGNLSYGSLDPDQKVMIGKLETQAGLPVGFISNLKMSASDRLINVNEKTGEALIMNEDGGFNVVQTGMRPSPTSSTTSDTKATREQFDEASTDSDFSILVERFAPTMSLEEIYKAYANTDRGRQFGDPIEDRRIMQMVWKIAHGDISEEDALLELDLN